MSETDAAASQGGVHAFSRSVGLDVALMDVNMNPIRGRVVALVVCAKCDGRRRNSPGSIIGKVLWDGAARLWLNHYAAPGLDYKARRDGGGRVPAPRITWTSLLQGPSYPDQQAWCEKHGKLDVPSTALYTAAEQGKARRDRPARLAI